MNYICGPKALKKKNIHEINTSSRKKIVIVVSHVLVNVGKANTGREQNEDLVIPK